MKVLLLVTFFTFPFNLLPVHAQQGSVSYQWFGVKLNLPFAKSWLVNKAKRKADKDPLVFFEPNSTPRIAAGLYHTNYDLNLKDYSAFQATFLKSKKAWLKKQSADLIGEIVYKSPKTRGGVFSYEMTFKRLDGSFKEIGLFRRCQGKSFTLKAMLPESRWSTQEAKEIISFFNKEDPCVAKKSEN